MKKLSLLLALLAVIVTATGQETKPTTDSKPSAEIAKYQLATQLADYGYKTFSANALIEAARIMSNVKKQELKYETYKQGNGVGGQENKQKQDAFQIAAILETAKKYAEGNAGLLASIADIERMNEETRGRVGGPGEKYSYVYGNSTDLYEISFIESRLAEILVIGDGDTDLDLYVYDSGGHLIAYDSDYTDRCYVSWVPAWTGRYIVKIVNRGPIINYYHLVTN